MTIEQQPVRRVDTTSLAARLTQAAMAVVLAIVSVLLMISTHRVELPAAGLHLPAGLLFGALFQVVASVFLWAATGSRLPLLVLGSLWGVLAMPFLGEGMGGGVMMPAMLGTEPQYSGWVVQGLGLVIPFLIAGLITLVRRSRSRAG
ncbi:hypothetical protein [uncultured Brachybacterium sp.]|uniref:hypothetical protein n=1 Tax=uncultured Brachybacterium sp. TaxID=189680 RepID=UPI002601969D|nr:hypothetical protein [uncultured Brachybacterium sp.]